MDSRSHPRRGDVVALAEGTHVTIKKLKEPPRGDWHICTRVRRSRLSGMSGPAPGWFDDGGTRNRRGMAEPLAFRYRAVADDGRRTEIFVSNVEYLAGDELPLRSARWTVERVEQEGIEHDDGREQTVRT